VRWQSKNVYILLHAPKCPKVSCDECSSSINSWGLSVPQFCKKISLNHRSPIVLSIYPFCCQHQHHAMHVQVKIAASRANGLYCTKRKTFQEERTYNGIPAYHEGKLVNLFVHRHLALKLLNLAFQKCTIFVQRSLVRKKNFIRHLSFILILFHYVYL
jgi:hypothetical protein